MNEFSRFKKFHSDSLNYRWNQSDQIFQTMIFIFQKCIEYFCREIFFKYASYILIANMHADIVLPKLAAKEIAIFKNMQLTVLSCIICHQPSPKAYYNI